MKGSLSSQIKNERKIECSFPVPVPKATNGCFTTACSTGSHSLAQITGERSILPGYVCIRTHRGQYLCGCRLRDTTPCVSSGSLSCAAPLPGPACLHCLGVQPCASPFLGTDAPSVSYKDPWTEAKVS